MDFVAKGLVHDGEAVTIIWRARIIEEEAYTYTMPYAPDDNPSYENEYNALTTLGWAVYDLYIPLHSKFYKFAHNYQLFAILEFMMRLYEPVQYGRVCKEGIH